MTAKQYLEQAFRLDQLISLNLQEIERLREITRGITSPSFEERPTGVKKIEPKFVKGIVDIDALEHGMREETKRMMYLKQEIRDTLKQLDNIDQRLILEYRYIRFLSWDQIKAEVNLSIRSLYRIHDAALKKLEENKSWQ